MSPVTEFVVYDIMFWFLIAVLILIAKRDRFARPVSERISRHAGPIEPKQPVIHKS
jgi:hypothetical protein